MRNELRQLLNLSVYAALGDELRLKRLFQDPRFRRLPRRKVREAILQVHLFAGFPAIIEAFSLYQDSVGSWKSRGLNTREGDGMRLFKRVYRAKAGKVLGRLKELDPELAGWIIRHGYKSVLARPGLSLRERELCAVAVLAATGWEKQLLSHKMGALNIGAAAADIDMAVAIGRAAVRQVRR